MLGQVAAQSPEDADDLRALPALVRFTSGATPIRTIKINARKERLQ